MNATEQAARWLADVQIRYFDTKQADTPSGRLLPEQWMPASEVVAAIARLFAPGDDLVERLQQAFVTCRPMNGSNDLDNAASAISDAIARISALTAHYNIMWEANLSLGLEKKAAEAEAATLRDRLARMEGALQRDESLIWIIENTTQVRIRDLTLDILNGNRAALTESPADGGKHE